MAYEPKCLFCGQTSERVPLVHVTYKDQNIHICSQHLPLLIHEPEKLGDRLDRAAQESAAE